MADAEAACATLCDPEREVSAHYVISETGAVWQLVEEEQRAWHAGAGTWQGRGDVNSRSIGIELANPGNCPYPAPLMDCLERLLADILARWQIAPQGVIGHSDMAPGRKSDPGPRFDWSRLAKQGLSVWSDAAAAPIDQAAFRRHCLRFGWPDVDDALLLQTFRLRFRPGETGPLDGIDIGRAQDLAERFGVDAAMTRT